MCLSFTHTHTPLVLELPCKLLAEPSAAIGDQCLSHLQYRYISKYGKQNEKSHIKKQNDVAD